MSFIISTTLLQIISLPFKISLIIVLNPIIRVFQILKYGLFIIPTKLITNIINLLLFPFNVLKPTMEIDYSMINIFKDLEVMYQFVICSILLGIFVGCLIGVTFCTINYLLTFTKTEWKLFDFYIPWKGIRSKKPLGSSALEELKLQKEKTDDITVKEDEDDGKMFTYVDDNLADSIYEDDDGYGMKLNNDTSSVSLRSLTNIAISTKDEGNSTISSSSSSSSSSYAAANNVTGSTSVTSYTEGEEEDGTNELRNRMLKFKRNFNNTFSNDNNEIESESRSDTETETEGDDNDQFFESPNRLITTIVEE